MSADDRDDAELARLRARAYGPDPDLAADPVALARLRQLESARRDRRPIPDLTPDRSADLGRRETPPRANAPASGPPPVPDTGAAAPPDTPARSRPTRRRVVTAAALAVVLVVVGFVGGMLAGGAPAERTAVLTRIDLSDAPDLLTSIDSVDARDYFGAAPGAPYDPYDAFHGLEPWGIDTTTGGACLVVVVAELGVSSYGCGAGDLPAVVDVRVLEYFHRQWVLREFAVETVIRFTLVDDRVVVQVAEPETAASIA